MSKYLVILLVIVLVFWVMRGWGRKRGTRAHDRNRGATGEDMVRCAQCGVHLPRSESLMQSGTFYCSAEHRREHENSG